MREDTVVRLRQPGIYLEDPLTEVLRLGARRLPAQAVEMEVTSFVEGHADLTDEAGRRRVMRHGDLPERQIQTGRLRYAVPGCAIKEPARWAARSRWRSPTATGRAPSRGALNSWG